MSDRDEIQKSHVRVTEKVLSLMIYHQLIRHMKLRFLFDETAEIECSFKWRYNQQLSGVIICQSCTMFAFNEVQLSEQAFTLRGATK